MAELWHGYKIPIIGLTGPYGSGKTLWGLEVDAPERTYIWDMEKSSESYEIIYPGLTRVDLHDKLGEKFKGSYTPEQVYITWRQDMAAIPNGKFTVGILDPASEVEAGLCDYVTNHPQEFGKTKNQFEKSSGIYWGVVKDLWKRHLMLMATKFDTFVFTVHLRQKYEGNAPLTGVYEPKGKDTLAESASLYLWLDRSPNSETPSARVLNKNRLCRRDEKGVVRPILPPTLKDGTPAGIRKYLISPADYTNLKPWEKHQKQEISEEDKMALRLATANAEKEAANAKRALAETIQGSDRVGMTTTPSGEMVMLRKQDVPPGADGKDS